jgi:HD-GYP domain-containing protein (c-di-GMP phosphodiesterase class II)
MASPSSRHRTSAALKRISVKQLYAGQITVFPLYHETASPIFNAGEKITQSHIQALIASGIKELFECKGEEELQTLAAMTKKRPFPLQSVPVGTPTPHNIYDGSNRFLLRKGRILASQQYDRMVASNMEYVYIDEEARLREINRFSVEMTKTQAESLEKKFQDPEELHVKIGSSILTNLFRKRPQAPRPPNFAEDRKKARETQVDSTRELLQSLRKGESITADAAEDVVKSLSEEMFSDVDMVANFANTKDATIGDYRHHSLNVATLALGVGLSLGYNERDLRDLGTAALIHEVGMLRVPKDLLGKKDALSEDERESIQNHPVLSLEYLERVRGIRERVALVVYQEHESPDRSGYPNKRPGFLIHDFAKIISICDAYEAMTAPRPYRDPIQPYHVVEQLVYAASKLRYDPKITRAFLCLIGLFPIGSWVKMSSGECAKVIGGNSVKYDKPLVNILYDAEEQPLEKPRVVNLEQQSDLKVVGILNGKFAKNAMEGF